MKYTKTHEAARATFKTILVNYFKGRISYMEMTKAIFKTVAAHRYNDAWLFMADIAMHSKSAQDFEHKATEAFTDIEIVGA